MRYEPAQKYIDNQNVIEHFDFNKMNDFDQTRLPKIVMIGSYNSGKTTLVNKLVDRYNYSIPVNTIAFDTFGLICKKANNENFCAMLVDTSGTERYRSLIKSMLRDADLAIIMFDLNNIQSFIEADEWISFFREQIGFAKLLIIGNKNDLDKLIRNNDAYEKAD